jgi:tRNA(Arg) A34 adenosine deaminase TadA
MHPSRFQVPDSILRFSTLRLTFILPHSVEISLPSWLHEYYESLAGKEFSSDEEMIAVAIDISSQNIAHQTGGPFGCAIFERCKRTGQSRLCSVGANRVMALHNSTLHGEMVAIQFAQSKLQTYSLRGVGQLNGTEYVLCTSCEPCAMCLGGTLWSGVDELICAATKDDAEAIGFNEGPVFEASYEHLVAAGVTVQRQVQRAAGAAVLQKYAETAGVIYNS